MRLSEYCGHCALDPVGFRLIWYDWVGLLVLNSHSHLRLAIRGTNTWPTQTPNTEKSKNVKTFSFFHCLESCLILFYSILSVFGLARQWNLCFVAFCYLKTLAKWLSCINCINCCSGCQCWGSALSGFIICYRWKLSMNVYIYVNRKKMYMTEIPIMSSNFSLAYRNHLLTIRSRSNVYVAPPIWSCTLLFVEHLAVCLRSHCNQLLLFSVNA